MSKPTRPEAVTISLHGITRDPVTFYRLREANAYMDALEADRDDAILTAFMLAEECDYTVMMEGAFFEVEEFIDKWREHVKELRDAK